MSRINRKFLVSFILLGLVSMVFSLGTSTIYSDIEYSRATLESGTIDISVDDQNPWDDFFEVDLSQDNVGWANVTIVNNGMNPTKIYKTISFNGTVRYEVQHALSYIVFDFNCQDNGLDHTVLNPESEDYYIVNRDSLNNDSYQVNYMVEVPAGRLPPTGVHLSKDSSIKFESTDFGLGEEGAIETDEFNIILNDICENVTVYSKAATEIANLTFDIAGSEMIDSLGFTVRFANITENEDGTYNHTFYVTSGGILQSDEWGQFIDYSLTSEINDNIRMIYDRNVTISEIKDSWMYLGMIDSGDWMEVSQGYHLNDSDIFEDQLREFNISIGFMATQINDYFNGSSFESGYFHDFESSEGLIKLGSANLNGKENENSKNNNSNQSLSTIRSFDLYLEDYERVEELELIVNPFDNVLNLDNEVEVVLLGSKSFDSKGVDGDMVMLGVPDMINDLEGVLPIDSRPIIEDVNEDGFEDVILRFPVNGTGFKVGENVAKIVGITENKIAYYGSIGFTVD